MVKITSLAFIALAAGVIARSTTAPATIESAKAVASSEVPLNDALNANFQTGNAVTPDQFDILSKFRRALNTAVVQFKHIVKRGEGIHLVNCGNQYSAVVYCENDGSCNFFPGGDNLCILKSNGLFVWEGGNKGCTFSTGTRFTWSIGSDAQNQRNYTQVGSGDNGFNKFTIFKDDKHTMYRDGSGNQCKSIYYCLP
ncbi:hypothetical protein B0H67DRAFT_671460 [Lasiosphaeris hirsuta]|uniref:Uncharacterized protein n=1 Tax=Lasiosphaeris hirsuta TaxID=260670 RepID=A0AA40DLA4_9PEZI|nr:hypothetical protein B0H67DRAFT_671460 [Lasiosphaeris hirsuta]